MGFKVPFQALLPRFVPQKALKPSGGQPPAPLSLPSIAEAT